MRLLSPLLLSLATMVSFNASAIDDFFEKTGPDSMNGVLAVKDPTYLKECGGCHFAYSPGFLPAASWSRMMSRTDKHFGENLKLDTATSMAVSRYLEDNAADKSPYRGSQLLMERIDPKAPPTRIQNVHYFRTVHRVVREVIARNAGVKVRTLVNCDGCHQTAAEGDFSLAELKLEGLPGQSLVKSKNFPSKW